MSFNICEFFVGAGGSHLGFLKNGFETLYVNDFDKDAIQTLTYNNKKLLKSAIVDCSDFTKINPQELKKRINKDIDVCFGGIVCKGFSLAGERSPNDPRNHFYDYYLKIIDVLRPKISIIENVKGMLNAKILPLDTPNEILNEVDELWQEMENYKGKKADLRKKNAISDEFEKYGKDLRDKKQKILAHISTFHISVIDDIIKLYTKIGYRVQFKVLNSAWYGSSTKRERLIIVAVRNDIKGRFRFPIPTHNSNEINTKMNFSEDELKNAKFKKAICLKEALAGIDYDNKDDFDNNPMKHSQKTIDRFKFIKAGSNIVDQIDSLPDELKISKFYSRGNTMRLDFNTLAPTLVPGHSNFPIHPEEHRSITVREAATITGFPLDYKFFGSHTKRCEQVGNAVPPPLSYAIAKATKEFLQGNQ